MYSLRLVRYSPNQIQEPKISTDNLIPGTIGFQNNKWQHNHINKVLKVQYGILLAMVPLSITYHQHQAIHIYQQALSLVYVWPGGIHLHLTFTKLIPNLTVLQPNRYNNYSCYNTMNNNHKPKLSCISYTQQILTIYRLTKYCSTVQEKGNLKQFIIIA